MKKNVFSLFFVAMTAFAAVNANAQVVSSLSENFDLACITSPYFPDNWRQYTPTATTAFPPGAWICSGDQGNHNTPGMMCTGYFNNVYNLDTSYLITPTLNLGNVAGDVFLRFDSRIAETFEGGKLSVMSSPNPEFTIGVLDLTGSVTPAIGSGDIAGWVTHELNLNALKGTGSFYLAFRYTSVTTAGSTWYIDNVYTDTLSIKVGVPSVTKEALPLSVIGIPESNLVTISYSTPLAGSYHLAVYDMVGREVYTAPVSAPGGSATVALSGLDLHSGLYCIKMGNEAAYGTTKMVIR